MKAIERRDVQGAWIVVSGPNTYNCYLGTDPSIPRCDCAASIYTGTDTCKHVRFVRGQDA